MGKTEISVSRVPQKPFVKTTTSRYLRDNLSTSSLIFVLVKMCYKVMISYFHRVRLCPSKQWCFPEKESSRFQKSANYVPLEGCASLLYKRRQLHLVLCLSQQFLLQTLPAAGVPCQNIHFWSSTFFLISSCNFEVVFWVWFCWEKRAVNINMDLYKWIINGLVYFTAIL